MIESLMVFSLLLSMLFSFWILAAATKNAASKKLFFAKAGFNIFCSILVVLATILTGVQLGWMVAGIHLVLAGLSVATAPR